MEVTTHSISSWAAGDKTGMLAFGIGISTKGKGDHSKCIERKIEEKRGGGVFWLLFLAAL